MDQLPTPASTLFSAILHALNGSPMSPNDLSLWLELLLEAVYVEDLGVVLVPESHAKRMFRKMGVFVKVGLTVRR